MFEQLLESIAQGLGRLGPYMLIGGQAVLLYGTDLEYVRTWLRQFDRILGEKSLERFEKLWQEVQS